jgi:hypothetical protein
MSFFSATAMRPRIADLAGVLCAQGQVVSFARTAARISVVVEEQWRARAIAEAFAERGIEPEVGLSDEGHPLVRTAFRHDLTPLALAWTRGAVKSVPQGAMPHGATLRLWVLAAGRWLDSGYLLGLDPRAPDTHQPLAATVSRAGLPVSLVGVRGGGPGLRLTGRRRLARLDELVGDPPSGEAERHWPMAGLVRPAASQ